MRISELIRLLNKAYELHGDVPVLRSTNTPGEIYPYTDAVYVAFSNSDARFVVVGANFEPVQIPNWERIQEGE